MGRIDPNDADNYQQGLNGEWFSLKGDGDIARVQFMVDNYEELPVFACHKVKVGEKERYVDCLRTYDEPIENCPFCAGGIPVKPVRFVVMFDHGDSKVKIWERGKNFIAQLQGYMERYSPLSTYVFEIERKGKFGDKETKYNVYPMDRVDAYDLTDIEMPEFIGGLILSKTMDDMDFYLDRGEFPREEGYPAPEPVRRGAPPARRAPVQEAPRRAAPPANVAPPRRAAVAPPVTPPAPPIAHTLAAPPASRRSVPPVAAPSTVPVATEPPLRGPTRAGRKPEVF